jgi:large subunit ribosomal protein L32e
MAKRFLRNKWRTYSKLGRGRKKKQKYRKSKGIDNKMRLKMKGNPRNISIGFRKEKAKRDIIKGRKTVLVKNIQDIKRLDKSEIGIVANIGDRKKKEIAEYLQKNKIEVLNLNPEKELKKIEEKKEERKKHKEEKMKKKKEKEKKPKKEEKKKKETIEDAVNIGNPSKITENPEVKNDKDELKE